MKNSRFVYPLALILGVASLPSVLAQTPDLQKGVSVQMATTSNAMPMPEADNKDAWIVAVSGSGQLYFGTQAVTPEGLVEEMRIRPRNREQKLYIKADARVPYVKVKQALEASKMDFLDTAVLLTTQPESPSMGTLVPPKGLEVMLAQPPSSEPVIVQLLNSGQKAPHLKVDNRDVSIADLQTALNQALRSRNEKIILIRADAELPFAQVAHLVDACRSVGAKVILPAEM